MNPLPTSLFRTVAPLLIVVSVALVCSRIMNAELVLEPSLHRNADEPPGKRLWPTKVPKPMPTFSSNDRSRWATIRALVDHGTYVIGTRDPSLVSETNKYGDTGIIFEDGWGSIDKVLKPAEEGQVREFYSSKPPLFSTLVAGEYWLLKTLIGWTLQDNPNAVVRTILLTVNVLPLMIYLLVMARLLDRLGTTDWGKLFVLTAAGFGTFVTTFAMTLNNHSPAVYAVLFAVAVVVPMWTDGNVRWWRFALAGLLAAFAAGVELPAAAFTALLFGLLLVRYPVRTLLLFVPAALLVAAAWFLTNYLAMGTWKPAYGEFGGPWYEYPGSHWLPDPGKPKMGIDWAFTKESRPIYFLHFLIGHHGWFSLTPIWFLALVGLLGMSWRLTKSVSQATPEQARKGLLSYLFSDAWPRLLLMTVVLSVVVMGFYLARDRWNYGGWTCGPRWLMWLTPFWLLALLPMADWFGQRRGDRWLCYVCLAVSVFSASYPAWNPWRHPWLYTLMESWGYGY